MIEKVGTRYLKLVPDHLSREFLTIASTFHTALKIPQPNIFTLYQHALPL